MAIGTTAAIALGAGAGAQTLGGLFGAHSASNQASRARQLAQQQFQFAQQFRPNLAMFSQPQQRALYEAILKQGSPTTTARQQRQARNVLTADFNKQTERQRQDLVESSARRGLFRSGIGAQQESQFLNEQNQNLDRALLNQQLAFAQDAANQRFRSLGAAQNFMSNQQAQQADLFRAMLGISQGQAGAAGNQSALANQAWQSALSAPANLLTQYGLLSALGGGGQGGGGMGGQGLTYNSPFNNPGRFSLPY